MNCAARRRLPYCSALLPLLLPMHVGCAWDGPTRFGVCGSARLRSWPRYTHHLVYFRHAFSGTTGTRSLADQTTLQSSEGFPFLDSRRRLEICETRLPADKPRGRPRAGRTANDVCRRGFRKASGTVLLADRRVASFPHVRPDRRLSRPLAKPPFRSTRLRLGRGEARHPVSRVGGLSLRKRAGRAARHGWPLAERAYQRRESGRSHADLASRR